MKFDGFNVCIYGDIYIVTYMVLIIFKTILIRLRKIVDY